MPRLHVLCKSLVLQAEHFGDTCGSPSLADQAFAAAHSPPAAPPCLTTQHEKTKVLSPSFSCLRLHSVLSSTFDEVFTRAHIMFAHFNLHEGTGRAKCPQCGSKIHITCVEDITTINGLQIFDQDAGPEINERHEKLLRDLLGPLLDHLKQRSENFKPLMIRTKILGTDGSSATPWIVVFCPAIVVKSVESFFQKDLARISCAQAQVDVAYVGRPLRLKSGSLLTAVEVAFDPREGSHRQIGSGHITLRQLSNTYHATMGGMLMVSYAADLTAICGLTVGHLLHHENANSGLMVDYDFDSFVSTLDNEIVPDAQHGKLGRVVEASFSTEARNLD